MRCHLPVRSFSIAGLIAASTLWGCVPERELGYSSRAQPIFDGGTLLIENGKKVACEPQDKWGCCQGIVVAFCKGGYLYTGACAGKPKCGWNATLQHYACGTSGGADPSGKHPLSCDADGGTPNPPPEVGPPPPPTEFGPPPPNELGPPPPPNEFGPPPPNELGPPPPNEQGLPPPNEQGLPPPNEQGLPLPNEQGAPLGDGKKPTSDLTVTPDRQAAGDSHTSPTKIDDSGCSCATATAPPSWGLLALLALLGLRRRGE